MQSLKIILFSFLLGCFSNTSFSATVSDEFYPFAPSGGSPVTCPTITINIISNLPDTCTSNSGRLAVSTKGGESPYTYNWSNTATDSFINNLGTGTYKITVTDKNKCTATATAVVASAQHPMTLTTSATPDTCGLGKGTATVTVTSSGNKGPLKYEWSNSGGLSSIITGLTSTTYHATVTDSKGCYASASVKVASVNNNCAKSLPSPVANYHFDACSGKTVVDSTGKFNATVVNPEWGSGYINQGLEFNGTSQSEVTVPTILSVEQIANGFTCSAWIKAASENNNRLILSAYGVGTPDVFWLFIAADGTLQYTFNIGMATTSFNTNYVVPVNEWTHIAVVYNQVNIILYANGTAVYSIPIKFHEPIPFGLRIGGSSSTDMYFSGTIDEVKVFTQILDSLQIHLLAGAVQSSKACGEGVREQILAGIESDASPESAALSCYPNPFSSEINFMLTLPMEAHVQLVVYDLSGKLIANLNNDVMTAGTHQISWNGKTKDGAAVASGIYVAHAIIGDKVFNSRIAYQHTNVK